LTSQGVIPDVTIKDFPTFKDARGSLTEIWRNDEMKAVVQPAMAYVSITKPDTARGPHEHVDQTDFFIFMGTAGFQMRLWDNRKNSSTFGIAQFFDCPRGVVRAVVVPPGVVHGYKNIDTENGLILNLPDRLYAGENKKEPVDEIRHEADPTSPFHF